MVTDEIMEAIDLLIEMCHDEDRKVGMEAVKDMLGNIFVDVWLSMTDAEKRVWMEEYVPQRTGCVIIENEEDTL